MTPSFQRRASASAAQCASSPQPIWRSGNGSSASNASARIAVTGPISTKRVRRAVSPGRRRVTSQAACEANACAGWARRKPWRSHERDEDVEEVVGELDVVVDDQEPLEAARRVGGERGVEVRPLPGALGRGDDPQQRVVVRGAELVADVRGRARVLRPHDGEHEHAALRLRAGGLASRRRVRAVRTSARASRRRPASSPRRPSVPERPLR